LQFSEIPPHQPSLVTHLQNFKFSCVSGSVATELVVNRVLMLDCYMFFLVSFKVKTYVGFLLVGRLSGADAVLFLRKRCFEVFGYLVCRNSVLLVKYLDIGCQRFSKRVHGQS
jgi:hypothetical protein